MCDWHLSMKEFSQLANPANYIKTKVLYFMNIYFSLFTTLVINLKSFSLLILCQLNKNFKDKNYFKEFDKVNKMVF